MTKKVTHASKADLRQEIAELRFVGAQMSNLCFNLTQLEDLHKANRETMDMLRRNWDAIKRRETPK